ncbi:hypothetical protein [Celeribacter neptunius]|uniref:Nitrate reductase gamma subunit n=1 Tax=Celeribacter neptunius TaxID=588602 RepID=A0A1I3NJ82_9RHOB|nr:hypothetical protein [Celeribacter neptunius]SFJ09363.1 hypothetical protein SAMN04487991_1388 [Celeribacter neptunius]
MSLLDFARGPALQWAAVIFVIGMLWRTVGLLLMLRSRPLSKDRKSGLAGAGVKTMFSRFLLPKVFAKRVGFQFLLGWVWHVGFVLTLFFFQVHVLFFKGVFGFSWPALPNAVVLPVAAVTLGILLILLVRRMTNPMLRYISNFNDYSSVIVTLLPFVTGFATFTHIPALAYETLLALHFLSVALLLVWFPFSKLFHVITVLPSRYILGVKFWRRGVEA